MQTSIWMHAKYKGLVEEIEFAARPAATTFLSATFDGAGNWRIDGTFTGTEDPRGIANETLFVMKFAYRRVMGFDWTPYFEKVAERLLVRFWTKRINSIQAPLATFCGRLREALH